ncbi:hypothetical protein EYZ11_010544 [Aspergillus tanneri]|uniref:Uncharacterized protein n=1 Tax=Aspergillus tanneri TaxID=1220188 RepID=A0A4S3J537_9EURO|nr:hypothetical protein EYZ11_010544 [Aspergillus tanneri]
MDPVMVALDRIVIVGRGPSRWIQPYRVGPDATCHLLLQRGRKVGMTIQRDCPGPCALCFATKYLGPKVRK